MTELIAVGYTDETAAAVAGEELVRLSRQLEVPPDDVAVVAVEPGGTYRATTRVSASGRGRGPAFWSALLGALVLEPPGSPAGEAMRAVVQEGTGGAVRPGFGDEVRRLLAPGASALLVLVDEGDADQILEALARYGGRPLRTSWGGGAPGSSGSDGAAAQRTA